MAGRSREQRHDRRQRSRWTAAWPFDPAPAGLAPGHRPVGAEPGRRPRAGRWLPWSPPPAQRLRPDRRCRPHRRHPRVGGPAPPGPPAASTRAWPIPGLRRQTTPRTSPWSSRSRIGPTCSTAVSTRWAPPWPSSWWTTVRRAVVRSSRSAADIGPGWSCGTGAAAPPRPGTTVFREVHTNLVAFLDSDCVPPSHWLTELVGLFGDPDIGAVAPRVRPIGTPAGCRPSFLDRYLSARSPLDLGRREARVRPRAPGLLRADRGLGRPSLGVGRRVRPVAALRRGRRPDLEDGRRGWHIRYVPSVTVDHGEPSNWRELLGRRYHYGTSSAPLARRHRGRLAPVVLRPLPAAAVVLGLARRMLPASLMSVVSGLALARRAVPVGNSQGAGGPLERTVPGVHGRGHRASGNHAGRPCVDRDRRLQPALSVVGTRPFGCAARGRVVAAAATRRSGALVGGVPGRRFRLRPGRLAGCIGERTFSPLIPSIRPIR